VQVDRHFVRAMDGHHSSGGSWIVLRIGRAPSIDVSWMEGEQVDGQMVSVDASSIPVCICIWSGHSPLYV